MHRTCYFPTLERTWGSPQAMGGTSSVVVEGLLLEDTFEGNVARMFGIGRGGVLLFGSSSDLENHEAERETANGV